MVRKNKLESKSTTTSCSSRSWTPKDSTGLILSEVTAYLATGYFLTLMNVQSSIWLNALVLLVLINISLWLCPFVRYR
ncbi:hypothetical protein HYT52_04955 [Candidatus Woesearchaeota archaeon]|nr:hypothetical protein [Candidatus Woesearchaeota archaeon]